LYIFTANVLTGVNIQLEFRIYSVDYSSC